MEDRPPVYPPEFGKSLTPHIRGPAIGSQLIGTTQHPIWSLPLLHVAKWLYPGLNGSRVSDVGSASQPAYRAERVIIGTIRV